MIVVVAGADVKFNGSGWHVTPTSSSWIQSTEPSGVVKCGHSSSLSSEPVQRTSSQKIGPLPLPNGGGWKELGSETLVRAPISVYKKFKGNFIEFTLYGSPSLTKNHGAS